MKSIKHFLKEGKFLDKETRYFYNAIRYNKGVALDAYYFNLFTPEIKTINHLLSAAVQKLKSIFSKVVFRLLLVLVLAVTC